MSSNCMSRQEDTSFAEKEQGNIRMDGLWGGCGGGFGGAVRDGITEYSFRSDWLTKESVRSEAL